jgi:predicted amino acid dehydrogenase
MRERENRERAERERESCVAVVRKAAAAACADKIAIWHANSQCRLMIASIEARVPLWIIDLLMMFVNVVASFIM